MLEEEVAKLRATLEKETQNHLETRSAASRWQDEAHQLRGDFAELTKVRSPRPVVHVDGTHEVDGRGYVLKTNHEVNT
jgi:hypothetical protein